jgi:hypothetical protein
MAGCGDSDETTPRAASTAAAESTASASRALVGEWRRETTCTELVQALEDAGLEKFIAEFVAGNGFVPGVRDAAQLADPRQPCEGAVPREHSHFFTADGAFGSRDWNGEQVDDGRYRVDGDTIVISKEFPDVTFRYRVDDDTITFDPEIPARCTTFRCAWSVSMAYPGKKWTLVK